MTRWQWPVFFVGSVFLLGYSSASPRSPLAPANASSSFRLADANLVIELVAAEPAVVSPVAMAWDEDGRLFVAEMADYPAATSGGRIKLLEDRDGDGQYEKATVFADKLAFPNGVLPYKGGVLVTAAPNIWFFKDTDGDGQADERRVLFTGFGEGNQQLRVNGLHWGLDNWVYGANGRSDGDILPSPSGRGAGGEGKPISIRRRDFRFQPHTLVFEAIAGFSQFGLPRDDWGRRFPSWNTVPLRHVVLEERYLSRNPHLAETTSVANILDSADAGRVYPISPPPQTFNREPLDYFNASCGPTIYRGDRLGKEYEGNAFVCESLLNLVHRRVLTPAGPTVVARRAEQGKEFLAATDPWFHPVNLATGPDGALYVVDFYRQWVEHPQFVPAGLRQSVDFRRGHEHGRIWRIRHKDMALRAAPRLGKATVAELVENLSNINGWRRDTVQRLLVERQDRQAVPLLQKAARRATSPLARLHSLWTLHGLQALDDETMLSALRDSHPGVREQGLRLVEGRSQTPALQRAVLNLAGDGEVRVRFQCALALGELAGPEAWKALAQIAQRDAADNWVRLAVLSSLGAKAWPFLQVLLEQKTAWLGNPTEEQTQFLRQVGALIGTGRREEELAALCNWAAQAKESPGQMPLILIAGLAEGLARSGQPLPGLLAKPPANLVKPLQGLEPQLAAARNLAMADKETASQRVLAWQVLLLAQPQIAADLLLKLLQPSQPPSLQTAAARGLAQLGSQALAAKSLDQWHICTIQTRREILASLLRSAQLASVLVAAVEQEKIAASELDAVARDALVRIPDAALQKRVRTLFKQETASNRPEVIRKYQPALALTGNRQRGAELFAKHCQACHQLQGQGQRVGPDLSAVGSRPREVLLQDLLDPSKEISPDFMNFVLVTKAGQVLTGLLAAETATGVKLRRAEGAEDTVLRSEIQELRATGKSLMPEGLEQQLSLQNVADLLAFLRPPGR